MTSPLPFGLNEVMAFQPPQLLIERFAKAHSVSEQEAREQFEEIKKFLVVCASDRSKSYAPSRHLDDMWHDFVLFTPEYSSFCQKIGGFVHHRPTQHVMHDAYANTLSQMPEIFKVVNDKWWKPRSAADCDSLCSDDDYCTGDQSVP